LPIGAGGRSGMASRSRSSTLVLGSEAEPVQERWRELGAERQSVRFAGKQREPQLSLGRAGVTNSIPWTFESRSISFEKNGSCRSECVACFSLHKVPQLLCNPTRCGNRANGSASTLWMSCRNSTSS
jgi:hypothetical protein